MMSRTGARHPSIMRSVLESFGGVWELLVLAFKSRLRMNSPYWKWRNETAFGSDPSKRPPLRERIHAIMEYGKWVRRMKRRL
jgi:hypothetical protein